LLGEFLREHRSFWDKVYAKNPDLRLYIMSTTDEGEIVVDRERSVFFVDFARGKIR